MEYDGKVLVRISYSAIRLLLSPRLQNITQRNQIMCGGEIYIQAVIYQESLNNWRKRRLIFINNHANSLIRATVEHWNT